ncbi:Uncharacterized protein dnm_015980 [Desulfonema magnum]|uniref:Uncharacterized protein n=1 Tax=Desulfonema magnum TaxID=45655 RepID=A0A975GLB3_9BACT|nr:Uncharacterized protein dnm_015980 [Desulfonema magnum]
MSRESHANAPECKNYIFALAKKYFSHSGENAGKFVQS